jgi:hypothetical protein
MAIYQFLVSIFKDKKLGVSFKNITLRGFLALHLTGKLFLA